MHSLQQVVCRKNCFDRHSSGQCLHAEVRCHSGPLLTPPCLHLKQYLIALMQSNMLAYHCIGHAKCLQRFACICPVLPNAVLFGTGCIRCQLAADDPSCPEFIPGHGL